MTPRFLQKSKQIVTSALLVILFLTSFSLTPYNQNAYAQNSVNIVSNTSVTDIKTSIESTISAAADSIVASVETSLFIKEWTVDGIAFGLAKTALKSITKSIVKWINSGFQGSPAFVGDLEAHLIDLADKAAGELIYGSELSFLCSPIEINLRAALAVQQFGEFEEEVACTLTDVVDNIDSFYAGNFEEGGWRGWFELVNEPQNNPYGALAEASAELSVRITTAQDLGTKELDFGAGFLSFKECTPVDGKKKANGEPFEQCLTVTPGSIIQENLNFQLTVGDRVLLEADEFNEIIGALFSQLGQQALTGAAGLLGLSRSGGSGSPFRDSYLTRLEQEDRPTQSDLSQETAFIRDAIRAENDIADLELDVVFAIDDLETFIIDTHNSASSTCPGLPDELPSRFVSDREDSQDAFDEADANILTLEDIFVRYNRANNDQDRLEIFLEFSALQSAGLIRNDVDVVRREFEVEDILKRVSAEQARVTRILDRCENNDSP